MAELGTVSELEAELIKRNREIAKVRDEVLKAERRLEDSQMRNDDLLEKLAEQDAEVTKKTTMIKELGDKVMGLEKQLAAHAEESQTLQTSHGQMLESLRLEMTAKESARQEDKDGQELLQASLVSLESEVAKLQKRLEEEEHKHCDTKARLMQAESSSRDLANRSVEQRRVIEELQDEIQKRDAGLSASQEKEQEERAKLDAELENVRGLMHMHQGVREDLEEQARVDESKYHAVLEELKQERAEMQRNSEEISHCEAARDAVRCEFEEHKKTHDDVLHAERKRNEEHLHKITQQAASLDGRLSGQRLLLVETSEALARSENAEAKVSAELTAKLQELSSEYQASTAALQQEREKAARDADERDACRVSELETAEVCLQRQAHSEIDAARRLESEAEEQQRRLEAKYAALAEDHGESREQQSRQQETLRAQSADLRQRLVEAEERNNTQQHAMDTLRRDLEEARLEAERVNMSHRLELERFQQTLEVELQSRSSAEKIAESKLEEKDTLLQHRASAMERVESDLESARKKVEELEESVVKTKTDAESKVHGMTLRNAQVEGELRSRQERLTEVEGRLDAQRQYLEQLSESLSKAQTDRDALMETKGSLETQLKLETTQKEAMSTSLQQMYDEASSRCQELETQLLQERDSHRQAMEDLQRSLGDDLRQGSERQTALERELLSARERCEHLMRNKADLQEEVGQHGEKHAALEARLQEHRAEQEQAALEFEQTRNGKAALESELTQLKEAGRERDAKIAELSLQVRDSEEQRSAQLDDFKAKVKQLDDLIQKEQQRRADAEQSLLTERQDAEHLATQKEHEHKRSQQQLQEQVDTWRDKAEEAQVQLGQHKEQADVQRARAEDLDAQRREMEAQLRGEVATAEARLRRVEAEAQRAQSLVEETKATLAQQSASATAKVTSLQQNLDTERGKAESALVSKETAEQELESQAAGRQQMAERLGMAAEELFTRQVDFALEKQRLSGALEESRRTLRNSLGVPNPVAAVDSVRIVGLETQLAEERRKSIQQAVVLQRVERRCSQLEDAQKRSEDQRGDAVQRAREAERQRAVLSEEVRKAQLQQSTLESHAVEARERAAMSTAELGTFRYESKYEFAKLRGALDELRFMLRMQDGAVGGSGSSGTLSSIRKAVGSA